MTAQSTFFQPTSKVLAYKIEYPRSMMLLEEKIKEHNAKATRTEDRIKVTHQALAEKLIRMLRKYFYDWQALNGFIYNPHKTCLPTLRTNNEFLAKMMGCTSRTIRNYRDRLEALNLITVTVLHGTNANFELAINPEFLWITSNADPLRILPPKQIFPLTSTSTKPEQLEQQEPVSGKDCAGAGQNVDNSSVGQRPHQDANAPATAQLPEQPEQPEPNHRNESSGCATGTPSPVAPGVPAARPSREHRQAARLLADAALRKLYPGRKISVFEKMTVEEHLDRLLAQVTLKQLPELTNLYTKQIKLVALQWSDQMGIPLPDPTDFFNPDNPNGFALTWDYAEEWQHKLPSPSFSAPSRRSPTPNTPTTEAKTGEIKIGNLFNQFLKNE
jgi:hypothetical protein